MKLLPQTESQYVLLSPYSVEKIVSLLSRNVTKRQLTISPFSPMADAFRGSCPYFEGEIDQSGFKINHKVYWYNSPLQLLDGKIYSYNGNTIINIQIKTAEPSPNLIGLLIFCGLLTTLIVASVAGRWCAISWATIFIFIGIFITKLSIANRTRSDKTKLKEILSAKEIDGSVIRPAN